MFRFPTTAPAGAQIALVSLALVAAIVAPPARGAMLAVPLTGTSLAATIDLALANGATIDGAGPIAGSVVLRGERRRLWPALRGRGVLLLAGSARLCRP